MNDERQKPFLSIPCRAEWYLRISARNVCIASVSRDFESATAGDTGRKHTREIFRSAKRSSVYSSICHGGLLSYLSKALSVSSNRLQERG